MPANKILITSVTFHDKFKVRMELHNKIYDYDWSAADQLNNTDAEFLNWRRELRFEHLDRLQFTARIGESK